MRLHLHRLFTSPTVHVESADTKHTSLRIDGLVCDDVCAVRSQRALSQLPGVTHVSVDFETRVATVNGSPQAEADYQRALDSVVAMKPLRRWLASLPGRRPRASGSGKK